MESWQHVDKSIQSIRCPKTSLTDSVTSSSEQNFHKLEKMFSSLKLMLFMLQRVLLFTLSSRSRVYDLWVMPQWPYVKVMHVGSRQDTFWEGVFVHADHPIWWSLAMDLHSSMGGSLTVMPLITGVTLVDDIGKQFITPDVWSWC